MSAFARLKEAALVCLWFLPVLSHAADEIVPPLWSTWTQSEEGEFAVRLRAYDANAQILLDLEPSGTGGGVTFQLEGPLPDFGDKTPVGQGSAIQAPPAWDGKMKTGRTVNLPRPGIYRLIVKPSVAGADYAYRLRAGLGASRSSITLPQFLSHLRDTDGPAFKKSIEGFLQHLGQDPATASSYATVLSLAMRTQDFGGLERFPTLPSPEKLHESLRKLRAATPVKPEKPNDPVFKGDDLAALLKAAPVGREDVPPAVGQDLPPELTYGHYPDQALPAAFAAQSPVLAQVFTSLASRNGSSVTLPGPGGKPLVARSPKEVMEILIRTGHRVRVYQERSLANFLALNWKGTPIYWPTWEDTGLKLAKGDPLVVPTSHSQPTWEISGPLVNARVAMYLGMYGVGFWAASDERPSWTGFERRLVADSRFEAPKVLGSLELAAEYHRMIRKEQQTRSAGMPGAGYFFLGVCNDNPLEGYLTGGYTAWPMTRPHDFLPTSGVSPKLAYWLSQMPTDVKPFPSGQSADDYKREVFRRVRASVPANAGILRRDPDFRTLIVRLREEAFGQSEANGCSPRQYWRLMGDGSDLGY